jgi:hypothetical protein
MTDVQKMTEVTVLTRSTEPLIGIIQVATVEAEMEFEITVQLALEIYAALGRFLDR